ncbi:unnamed protein product [Cunninghamella echinulata]
MSETSDHDLEYVTSLLLNQERGLLKFMITNIQLKNLTIIRAETTAIEFIISFISKAKFILQSHSTTLEKSCIILYGAFSSKIRLLSIELLIELMKNNLFLNTNTLEIRRIYEKFKFEMFLKTLASPLKGKIMELLGTIAKHYPDQLEQKEGSYLLRVFTNNLTTELQKNESSHPILTGALLGICCLLSNEKFKLSAASNEAKSIYTPLKSILNIPNDLSRYSTPIAALDIIIEHSSIFGPYLIQDYDDIYTYIQNMSNHQNKDLSKVAYRAMDHFFEQIGSTLSHIIGPEEKKVFKFFMQKFFTTLQSHPDKAVFDGLSISIRGIGYFSKAANQLLKKEELEYLQEQLIKKGNWFYSEMNSSQDKEARHLPSFIRAYTLFSQQYDEIPPPLLSILFKMVNVFVQKYNKLSLYTRKPGVKAIQSLIEMIYLKGEGHLRSFLNNFLYNLLICTCKDNFIERDPFKDDDQQHDNNELIYIWQFIFNYNYFRYDEEKNSSLHIILYDEFLKTVLRVIKSLNLDIIKVNQKDDENIDSAITTSTNIENNTIDYGNALAQNLEPVNQKDFILFHNLVEFWCAIVPQLDNRRLADWIYTASTTLIQDSLQKPLVSGFYRMLAVILNAIDQLKLFVGYKKKYGDLDSQNFMKTNNDEVYFIFYDYLHQLWYRMKQFKDELLASCLKLILASPIEFFDIEQLVNPLQTAIRFGLSYHPMIMLALNTLESLFSPDSSSFREIQDNTKLLDSLLPLFNDYLMKDMTAHNDIEFQILPNKYKIPNANKRRSNSIHRKITQKEMVVIDNDDSHIELYDIQLRIMRFLGRIGGANKSLLNTSNSSLNDSTHSCTNQTHLTSWDSEQRLSIHIPFPNAGVQLSIAELLPHICELSESSPDRKVKVASCEMLHSLVLLMIGNSAFQARDQNNATLSRYQSLYKHIFPVLLRLSIDMEQVTRDMFCSLVTQLIHWLTNNAQYESPETMILLQTCLDASCANDAALRDYGVTCIFEFVKWSIKQSSAQSNRSSMNMKSLLKRLYHLALHPNSTKRLGASLIFNRIYRLYREENILVDEFTLELLYHFMLGLRLAEDDHPSIGTQQQVKESISHLKRIFRVKSSIFINSSSNRRVFPGTNTRDLPSVIEWCFKEGGRYQREYAKTCVEFFNEFVLVIPEVKDGADWLQKRLNDNANYLVEIFEPTNLDTTSLYNLSNHNSLSSHISLLRQLSCTIDGYTWLLERQILQPSNLLKQINQPKSSLLNASIYLLKLDTDGFNTTDKSSINEYPTLQRYHAYNSFRLICLLNTLMESIPKTEERLPIIKSIEDTELLNQPNLYTMVATFIISPHHIVDSIQSGQNLLVSWIETSRICSTAIQFLRNIHKYWAGSIFNQFCLEIHTLLQSPNTNLLLLNYNQCSIKDMMQAAHGIKQLQSVGLLEEVFERQSGMGHSTLDEYCQTLFSIFLEQQTNADPSLINIIGEMIQIPFSQPHFVELHGEKLLGYNDNVKDNSDKERLIVYQNYSNYINKCIALNFGKFIPYLIARINEDYIKQIIFSLLDYLKINKGGKKKESNIFCNDFLSNPEFLDAMLKNWGNLENYPQLVDAMKGIFSINLNILKSSEQKSIFNTLIVTLEHLLEDNYPLSIKSNAFDLLPFYIQLQGNDLERISKAIKSTINNQFPISFSSDNNDGKNYKDSIVALDKLLNIMARFYSVTLFKLLIPTFMQDNGKVDQEMVKPAISNFSSGLNLSSFIETVQMCFNYFKNTALSMNHRSKAIELVISICTLVPYNYIVSFYESNILYIMRIIKQEELRRGTDEEITIDLYEKMCCFKLLQIMYELLPVKLVHSPESKISAVWENYEKKPSQGRKMTIDLVSQAHQAKSKKNPSESENLSKARLKYQQAAYNAAAAAIHKTQKSEKFFVGFLFQEKNQEPLWENILDLSTKLNLKVEFNQPLLKIRVEDFRTRYSLKNQDTTSHDITYMASVDLAGSSLSQDSLTDMAIEEYNNNQNSSQKPIKLDQSELYMDLDQEITESGTTVRNESELELDQFNKNPCIKLLTVVIRRLHTTITPPIANSTDMPLWMNELFKSFNAPDVSLVAQLYLAKLIINCPDIFEHYAQHWIRPLIKLAINGNQYGQPMNYFVQDLCVIIIAWGSFVTFEYNNSDRILLSKFMNYLVSNAYHEDSRLLRNNIQIIKGVFDNWKKLIIIPTKLIYQEIIHADVKSRKSLCGIQVIGAILAHDINVFYDGNEVDLNGLTEVEFYNAILKNLFNQYRDIYAGAAEVIAWSLSLMKKRHYSDLVYNEVQTNLIEMISKFDPIKNSKNDPSKFLAILHRIQLHNNDICQPFISKIYHLLIKITGSSQVQAIEIITGCSDQPEEIFRELQSKGLTQMITNRNSESQLAILKLLNKIISSITVKQIEFIFNDLVITFQDHINNNCKDFYYRILQAVYDRLPETSSMQDRIKLQLLQGLVDSTASIRNDISLYLQKKFGMTTDIYERAKIILKDMYMPSVENKYTSYSTQLLLDITKNSYEYDKPIFNDPLPNAHFDKHIQDINTSWKRNFSMVPLFVATQQQQQFNNEVFENHLRRTQQTLEFSQTQQGASSLMSTFGNSSSSYIIGSELISSMENLNTEDEDNSKSKRQNQYAKLRKRYVKSTKQSTVDFFVQRNQKLNKNLQYYQTLQKTAREKRVILHRKYRIGELPDIQIKYSELVEPLKALGRMDPFVARTLYTQLIVSIAKNAEKNGSKENYIDDIINSIGSNMKQSNLFYSPTIGAFLRIYYELDGSTIDSELIRTTSERSYNHHLGIAVLERQIERGGQGLNERSLKRIKTLERKNLSVSIEEWINLATLYQDIDEPEIFESLYRTHIASNELPKKAVDAKIRGEIAESCNLFMESMDSFHNQADPQEYSIWERERLRCFEQLTQWDDVAFHVKHDLAEGYTQLWDKNYQIPYLHYFLRSNVKLRDGITDENGELIPWTETNPNPIFPFLKKAMQSQDKLNYLLQHHGSEISLAAIHKNDYDQARHYIKKSYEYLQSTWSSLHPLANGSRKEKLAYLQKIVDMEDFLTIISHIQRDSLTMDDLKLYIDTLKYQHPDKKLDGMDVWDDILDSRMVYLDHISKLLNQQIAVDIQGITLNCRKSMILEMISAAREQNNFNVAIDRWQRILQLGGIELYQRNYALIQIELQRAITTDDHAMKSQMAARTLGLALKYKLPASNESEPEFFVEYNLTIGKIFETARIQLQNDPNTFQDFKMNKTLAKQLEKQRFNNVASFANYMAHDGFVHFNKAVSLASEQQSSLEADCLWKFGEYCDNILRLNENQVKQFPITIDTIQYCKIIINNFFRAIHLGHSQAVEHFPRLLELIERYPEAGQDFETNAEKCNITWYYIRWIPQLIAILDRPIAKHVFPIVYRLAQDYPSALYYPFHISNEHFECFKEQLNQSNREAIEKIKNTIRSPMMETFTMELRRLTNPEHIVKDFIDFIVSVGQRIEINNTFLNGAYQQFQDLLLNINSSKLGSIPKAFAVKHSSQLRELLGSNGSQIRNLSEKQLKKLLKYYQINIHNQKLPGAPELLKSYSPWLSTFQSTNFKEEIEIPGQYNGRTRPYPGSHIKIASFDERLLVMGSLRKPKRLRIFGTDGKEYMFLVKGGEDLRLDQRIQQLFRVINDSIQKEPYCAIHDVNNTTYNVIPMSTNVGMIEWVDNSKPLRHCIEDELKSKAQLIRVQENYRIFVSRFKGDVMGYHNLFKAPRDIVVKNFEHLTKSFQNNILKKYLIKLASSPEAFIFMRNNFAHSLAAICISGYILGIGDRHLENIMIDKRSGTLLAIDFGHAFGSATELLPVPELIPFRLTRQLVGALEPLGIKGILEAAMVHILEGIQQEKQVILNVMDVFVKEPLLDWKKNAAKQAKAQRRGDTNNEKSSSSDMFNASSSSTSSSSSSVLNDYEWYPQQKLNIAKKKLDGFNPTVILREELECGHKEKQYFNHLEKVIVGDPNINIRAKVNDKCSNTVEQVQCLIDLATDPNVLGRTWLGWQAFL